MGTHKEKILYLKQPAIYNFFGFGTTSGDARGLLLFYAQYLRLAVLRGSWEARDQTRVAHVQSKCPIYYIIASAQNNQLLYSPNLPILVISTDKILEYLMV